MCQELFLGLLKKSLDTRLSFWYNIQMENLITNIDFAFLVILVGACYSSFIIGKKEGIGATLDYMKEQGKIDFED